MTYERTSQLWDLAVIACMVGPITILSLFALNEARKAARADRLLRECRADLRIARAAKLAARLGWLRA